MWRLVLAVSLLPLVAASAPPSTPPSTYNLRMLQAMTNKAQAQWQANNYGLYGYQFDMEVVNLAISNLAVAVPVVTIQALNGTLVSVQTPRLGLPVNSSLGFDQPYNEMDAYLSIEQYFQVINFVLQTPQFRVLNLTFDPNSGMPLALSTDYDDSGLSYVFGFYFGNLVTFSATKPMKPLPNLYNAAVEQQYAIGNQTKVWFPAKTAYNLTYGYVFAMQILPAASIPLPCSLCLIFVNENNMVVGVVDQYIDMVYDYMDMIFPIDTIFQLIGDGTAPNSPVTVDALYDPTLGYPTWFLVTETPGTVNQTGYAISSVFPCDPAENCTAEAFVASWGVPVLENGAIVDATDNWILNGFQNKSYTVDFFNSNAPSPYTTLSVTNGNVTSVYDTAANAYVDPSEWFDFYKSVEACLATLLYVNQDPAIRVQVSFDPKTGMPMSAYIMQFPVVQQEFAYSNLKRAGLDGGQIFGIVFGVLVGVALIAVVGFFLLRRYRSESFAGRKIDYDNETKYGAL